MPWTGNGLKPNSTSVRILISYIKDKKVISYDYSYRQPPGEQYKLNIKSSVVDFAHLIEQDVYIEGGVSKVYSIAAEFGIGKTFFCEKLKCVLKKDNVQTIKMNIWEMDFYENPLMPILATLNEIYKKNGENLPAKIINSTLNFTKKSLAVLCEAAVKSASNQILDVDIAEVMSIDFLMLNQLLYIH